MRLALLASLVTFAGSLAGFTLASATGGPVRELATSPPGAGVDVVRVSDDCPKQGRSWEDAT
jgi:hypothetical protein